MIDRCCNGSSCQVTPVPDPYLVERWYIAFGSFIATTRWTTGAPLTPGATIVSYSMHHACTAVTTSSKRSRKPSGGAAQPTLSAANTLQTHVPINAHVFIIQPRRSYRVCLLAL